MARRKLCRPCDSSQLCCWMRHRFFSQTSRRAASASCYGRQQGQGCPSGQGDTGWGGCTWEALDETPPRASSGMYQEVWGGGAGPTPEYSLAWRLFHPSQASSSAGSGAVEQPSRASNAPSSMAMAPGWGERQEQGQVGPQAEPHHGLGAGRLRDANRAAKPEGRETPGSFSCISSRVATRCCFDRSFRRS